MTQPIADLRLIIDDRTEIEYHYHTWTATPEAFVCGHVNRDGTACGAITAGWSWPNPTFGMHVTIRETIEDS